MSLTSESGLTVGLRIVLSVGAVLFPLTVPKQIFLTHMVIIAKFTALFFLIGVLREHWLFVFPGLLPFLFTSVKEVKWKLVALFLSLVFIYFDYSFTLKISILLAWSVITLLRNKGVVSMILKSRLVRLFIFILPFSLVFYAVQKKALFTLTPGRY